VLTLLEVMSADVLYGLELSWSAKPTGPRDKVASIVCWVCIVYLPLVPSAALMEPHGHLTVPLR